MAAENWKERLQLIQYQLNTVFLKEWHLLLVKLKDSGNKEIEVMLTQKGESIYRKSGGKIKRHGRRQ